MSLSFFHPKISIQPFGLILRYVWEHFPGRTSLARVFLMSPLYHNIWFCQAVLQLIAGLLTVSVPVGLRRPIKECIMYLRKVFGLAFLFVFDFARSPTDAKPPDDTQGVTGVSATRLGCERPHRPSRAGLACLCKMSCNVFTAQLAF